MSERQFAGQGPFGPCRTMVRVADDGRPVLSDAEVRYLTTGPNEVEGLYGIAATQAQRDGAQRRVAKRFAILRRQWAAPVLAVFVAGACRAADTSACTQYSAIQQLARLPGVPPWLGMEDDAETLTLHFQHVALTVWPDSVRWANDTVGAYATAAPVPATVRSLVRQP